MKFGLVTNKGFITILCMSYFMVISYLGVVNMMILENRMSFYKDVEMMDHRVYFEVLIMHRIKDSYTDNLLQDCILQYEDIVANLTFKEDFVIVEYSCDNVVYKKEYEYDAIHNCLRINDV